MAKSLVDLAFDYVSSKAKECSFDEIWAYVCEQNGVDVNDMSRKAQFYSNLSIDGRLYNVSNNQWNLTSLQSPEEKKERYKYDAILDKSDSEQGEIDPEESAEEGYETEVQPEAEDEEGETKSSEDEEN